VERRGGGVFTWLEAENYRIMRSVSQALRPFQILIGPNSSGKSTFLDCFALLSDLFAHGLDQAILARSTSVETLTWSGTATTFRIALEARLPEGIQQRHRHTSNGPFSNVRYEVVIGSNGEEPTVAHEVLWLKPADPARDAEGWRPPNSRAPARWRKVVYKVAGSGNDYFISETSGYHIPFRIGPRKLALANLPEDEEKFPAAIWFKRQLVDGLQQLRLNADAMRAPCPPWFTGKFQPDGANLPLVVERLRSDQPGRFNDWVAHVALALPGIHDIATREREDDRYRYVVIRYDNGVEVPSWLVSDGSLRVLALTVLAYLPENSGTFLIEEPENGVHPRAVEAIYQSLSSVYGGQVFVATHSPLLLGLAKPEEILCFSREPDGSTAIVRGDEHPALTSWRGTPNLDVLYAAGIL
jgi:predicted ATPase